MWYNNQAVAQSDGEIKTWSLKIEQQDEFVLSKKDMHNILVRTKLVQFLL